MFMRKVILTICFAAFWTGVQRSDAQLIAEVRTSAGNFSIDLNFTGARRTVAHFMRLANGTQPWMNEKTGRIVTGTPFYNGLSFYRIVDEAPPFFPTTRKYIQAGARYPGDAFLQELTQGAGYNLRDEIRRFLNGNLIIPHLAYTVTMANTGPHSSSSQFLITVINDSSLDNKNSAFGTVQQNFIEYNEAGQPISVTNGRAVVATIQSSFIPATINSITFRRIGIAANQFDETAPEAIGELPILGNPAITAIHHGPTHVTLTGPQLISTQLRLFTSVDLNNWLYAPLSGVYTSSEVITNPQVSVAHGGAPRGFYWLAGASYPRTASPANLLGKTIFVGRQTPESIRFIFDINGLNPIYQRISDGATGALTYTYTRIGPFRGDLEINTPGLPHRIYRLFFGGTNLAITTNEDMACQIVDLGLAGQPVTDTTYTVTEP